MYFLTHYARHPITLAHYTLHKVLMFPLKRHRHHQMSITSYFMVPDMTNLCSYFQIKLNLYLDLSLVWDLCVVVHTFINYVLLGQQVNGVHLWWWCHDNNNISLSNEFCCKAILWFGIQFGCIKIICEVW